MANQPINRGSAPNDGTGDSLYDAAAKVNSNFAELYAHGAVTTQTGTTYTAVLADSFSYIRFTNGSAVSFTIPPNSSVAFPVGASIEVEQAGAGTVTFVPGAGVTLNSRGGDLALAGQYAVAFAKKVATDTWTVGGDL